MINCSVEMKLHLASPNTSLAKCWKVTLVAGSPDVVYGFTDHDQDIVFSGVTYRARTGLSGSDVASASDLSVDNLEANGLLISPAITEADLIAGIWDFADVETFMVNWNDLTMGALILRTGKLGEVGVDRGTFKAEIRGLLQAYSRVIGELTSPGCRAELFDARCKVDPAAFTVTGTIEGVNGDDVTLYDSNRTEPGPTGGIAITGVTNADPGVVSVADASTLFNGLAVEISGVVGMVEINTTTFVRNLNTTANTFDLPLDTSGLGAYVSGGTVTPLGSDSGYFDFGTIIFLDGDNVGRSMEIRSYVPGQWTLQLPMPYAVEVGDAYMMKAGCNKALTVCIVKFNNVKNFRGEPYLPGIDQLLSVGTQ